MIDYAYGRKSDVIKMWRSSFFDTDAYYDLYFSKVYRDDNTLVYYENDRAVSSLQMLPYRINLWGQMLDMGYISGVVTLPESRGKGYAGDVLIHSFKEMKGKGYVFTSLIPQNDGLFRYYDRFGYTSVCYRKKEKISLDKSFSSGISGRIISKEEMLNVYGFYNDFLSGINMSVQKTSNDFKNMVEENSVYGCVVVIEKDRDVCGVSFCALGDEPIILECISDKKDRACCENETMRTLGLNRMDVMRYTDSEHSDRFAMFRVLDPFFALKCFSKANVSFECEFEIYDPLIDENNGRCVISGSDVTFYKGQTSSLKLGVQELTRLVMGVPQNGDHFFGSIPRCIPYMNLMLN